MFMMTTEVDGGRNQQPRNRHLNLTSQRIVDYQHPTGFVNSNFSSDDDIATLKKYVPTKPMIENHSKLSLPTGKPFVINHQDEGYHTDGKSNTSPSTTSPLSSSFSSMSTFDGSFSSPTSPSGGFSPNSYNSNYLAMHGNTQKCPAPQKSFLIQGNGKIHVNRHALVMAKKKDSPQEMQDNPSVNLEDRLRALTTIEEEEPGLSNSSIRETYKKEVYITQASEDPNPRLNQPVINDRGGAEDNGHPGQDNNAGFFRAVPVEIAAPQFPYDQRDCVDNQNQNGSLSNFRIPNSRVSPQPSVNSGQNANDKNWYDYRRYFEKDCEIPLHNIDVLNRGKFINAGSDNMNDKDINRQLETNATDTRGGQINANVSSNSRQPAAGRMAYREPNENLSDNSFREHPGQPSRGRFHGYSQNGQRLEEHSISHQNTSSPSMPELRFPFHSHPTSPHGNDNSQNPGNHPNFRPEESYSLPQSRHQQLQLDNQQNQYNQQHPFYNEQLQYPDAHLSNSHNRSSGSYNSLPRHYEDQRQHHPLFYSENKRDLDHSSDNDVVLRRSWASSSTRAIPDRIDRYSWQPESQSKHPNSMSSDRYSLDLGNIPQLQQQIRATSEMCLQASKRHVFASSADIYKLFQGQKKPSPSPTSSSPANLKDFPRSQNHNHRHSFHAMPGGSWTRSQQNLQQDHTPVSRDSLGAPLMTYSKQHAHFSNNPSHPSPSPGPLRGDHSIPLPQNSWTGNTFRQSNSPSSHSTFPLTLSEPQHIQRQSSGYSSENELQQIEQNAKAAKKAKNNRNNQHSQQGAVNSDQEFVPVDPSQDHDSSSSIIDNEPVYVNQPMLANARGRGSLSKSSPMPQSHTSSPPPPPLPARPQHLQQATSLAISNGNNSLSRDTVPPGYEIPTKTQLVNSDVENHNMTNLRKPSQSPAVFTQKQIINLNQKPITINSYVPNHSYNANSTNTNGPVVDNRPILPGGLLSTHQPLDFQSNQDQFPMEQNKPGLDYLHPPKRSNSSRSNRTNSSPCTPLSPLEIAQVLDVPFATNVISDECGDRLSTLV